MHDRISVSAICTFDWPLDQDLRFYAAAGITNVGISVAKLERSGWDEGTARVVDAGLRVTNLIGLGPFHLAYPDRWGEQQDRLVRAIDVAKRVNAECLVFTTGPAGPLTWEAAADALEHALAPVLREARTRNIPFAIEHTNSLRVDVGFVHTLRDAVDLARRLDTGVCMEINACWAERGLAATIREGIDTLKLVQVSDFKVGTRSTPNRLVPGDGDIPLARIIGDVLSAGYLDCFDLELIGPAITTEGYESAIPRSVTALEELLATAAR